MTITMDILILVLLYAVSVHASPRATVVTVTGGDIVGSVEKSAGGRNYFAYRAVPFAADAGSDNRLMVGRNHS